MMLEEIARMYGMNDYYDQITGKVYELSNAIESDKEGELLVPVKDVMGDDLLIGYARMQKVED